MCGHMRTRLGGVQVSRHDSFEGRCVTERLTDAAYAERLQAYREGGWPAWEKASAAQIDADSVAD